MNHRKENRFVVNYYLKFQVPLTVIRGPLVDEVHQQINPWISQVSYALSLVSFHTKLSAFTDSCGSADL